MGLENVTTDGMDGRPSGRQQGRVTSGVRAARQDEAAWCREPTGVECAAMEPALRLIVEHARAVLGALGAVLLLSAAGALGVVLDNDARALVSHEGEQTELLARHNALFGPDDTTLVVTLTPLAGAGLDGPFVSLIAELSDAIGAIPGVTRVDSPTSTPVLVVRGDDLLVTPAFGPRSDLVDEPIPQRLHALRASTRGRTLVSRSGRSFLVVAEMSAAFQKVERVAGPVREVRRIVEGAVAARPDLAAEVAYAGIPFTRVAGIEAMERELLALAPLTSLVIALLLLWQFRRVHAVVIPLSAVGIGVVITLGIAGVAGVALTPLSVIFPTLLLVVGIADGVHWLSRVHELRRAGVDRIEAIVVAGRDVGRACLLTSATSAVGFASLGLTSMPILRSFGLITATGICTTFVVLMVFLPASLSLVRSEPAPASPRLASGLDRLVGGLIRGRRPYVLVAVGGVLLVVAGLAARRIDIDYFFSEILASDHVVTRGNKLLDADFDGVLPIELDLSGPRDVFRRAEVLQAVDAELEWMRQEHGPGGDGTGHPGMEHPIALSEVLKDLAFAFSGRRALPLDDAAISQLLTVASLDDQLRLDRLVTRGFDRLRVVVGTRDEGGNATLRLSRSVEDHLGRALAPWSVKARVTGMVPLSALGFNGLVDELIVSLLVALAVIIVTIGLVFRSVRAALVSVLPNTLPLVGVLAAYALSGRYLDLFPSVTFCIAIGIAVDDTIHLVARFAAERPGRPVEEAIVRAARGSLPAVVNTSALLVGGFLVLTLSSFPPNRTLGALGAGLVGAALLLDLVLTPACLMVFYGSGGCRGDEQGRGTKPPTRRM